MPSAQARVIGRGAVLKRVCGDSFRAIKDVPDAVDGARMNLQNIPGAYRGPAINKGGTVGQDDTIDTNGFGDIT